VPLKPRPRVWTGCRKGSGKEVDTDVD
jgi:hypothetical protein